MHDLNVSTRLDTCFMAAFAFSFFFFFFLPAPLALFMGHEQCIKANEQCSVSVNSNQNFFFIIFKFQFSAK